MLEQEMVSTGPLTESDLDWGTWDSVGLIKVGRGRVR